MQQTTRFIIAIFLTGIFCAFLLPNTSGALAARPAKTLRLAHTNWSSSVASAHLVKAVCEEKLGIHCELMAASADKMWAAVAEGRADAMVSAWLPDTHEHYYKQFRNDVKNLGPNLEGTKTGLVVPDVTRGRLTAGTGIRNQPYMDIDSIPELKAHADKLDHRIVGIEPEAGIMRKTRQAMDAYGLDDFRLVKSSEISVMAELSNAVRHQQWIVITGWLPHWSFERWSLKFLEDPENIFGDRGNIHTIVRRDLKQDMPAAYRLLNRFHWQPEDIGQLMLWIQEDNGLFAYEKALRWMRSHSNKVAGWIK
ncbi:MAG: glycine betaine ABC transporter substrate-binding protein [Thermodesulfobacteriota bacterium]